MTKTYCDTCKRELSQAEIAERLEGRVQMGGIQLHISVNLEETSNHTGIIDTDICNTCAASVVMLAAGARLESVRPHKEIGKVLATWIVIGPIQSGAHLVVDDDDDEDDDPE